MNRVGLALLVALASLPATESAAAGVGECGGEAGLDGRTVECEIESGPFPGVETGGSSGSRLPAGWTVEVDVDLRFEPAFGEPARVGPFPCDPTVGVGPLEGAGDDPAEWPGRLGLVTVRDATGAATAVQLTCFGPTPGLPAWLPPTRGEIERALERAPWPASETGVDPRVEGLTGLETWLWSETAPAQPISVTVANATVTGTATPIAYRWHTGDGAVASASRPGSRDDPAATHVYETKDLYQIVLEIEWQADVEIAVALPGGGELRFRQDPPLAPVTVAGSRDYRVVEVRGVLVPNQD